MELVHGLNGLAYLLVSSASFLFFISSAKSHNESKIARAMAALGITYLMSAIISISWFFRILDPSGIDSMIINVFLAITGSLLISYCIFKLTEIMSILHMLMIFVFSIFSEVVIIAITRSFHYIIIGPLVTSLLMMLLVCLIAIQKNDSSLRKPVSFGLIYSGFSILLASVVFIKNNPAQIPWYLPTIFLAGMVYSFMKHSKITEKESKKSQAKQNAFVVLLKLLTFTLSLSAFILISAVSIHELGHALTAQLYGCSNYKAVIYDVIAPHTEIVCDKSYNEIVITMAGFFATCFVALLLMVNNEKLMSLVAQLLFVFGLMIAFQDFMEVGLTHNLAIFTFLISVAGIIYTMVRISHAYLKSHNF